MGQGDRWGFKDRRNGVGREKGKRVSGGKRVGDLMGHASQGFHKERRNGVGGEKGRRVSDGKQGKGRNVNRGRG
jgi:hypothetical protein